MTSFFGVGGNPFTTPAGQRIEQATDGSLASENWALNIEICDIINDTEEGPKDAIKALRKRLQQNAGKNYTVVMYTLTVLETCVKNCGKRFHVLVCNKEFIQELVKLIEPSSPSWLHATPWLPSPLQSLSLPVHIGPKNDPPTAVQEKVLSLIQSWADAFRSQPEMSGVVHVYQDLKLKGIEFPMTDLDTMAPIHTPQKSISDGEIPVGVPALVAQQQGSLGSPASSSPTPAVPVTNVRLTQDQMAKLHGELDVVQANMAVLNEMLSELSPGKEHPSDIQLLRELHATCKAMQQRLVELISKLANDELTAELLRVNDLLNNLFLRYSRFEKNRDLPASGSQPKQSAGPESLIDLTDEASGTGLSQLNTKMANLSMGAGATTTAAGAAAVRSDKTDSEFDMFAQSRNVTYETSKVGGSTYEANLKPDQVSGGLGSAVAQARSQPAPPQTAMHKESDFDEMAAWLGESAPQESLTSSEFDRFLAERAAAAEATPSTNTIEQSTPRHRRPNKDSEDASLFAL